MKILLVVSAILMSLSTIAAVNCDIYFVMPEVDGRTDLTEKVLKKFESKGYRISPLEKPSDIKDEGKVSYMSVFSDIHSLIGAKTTINLVDMFIEGSSITSRTQSTIELVRKPFWGPAEKSLLNAVENAIPSCI